MNNIFGNNLQLTTFGESHGAAVGGVLCGFPSNVSVHIDEIQTALERRKPGNSQAVSQRKESDTIEILSGIFEGKTLGTPIAFIIRNENQISSDYDLLKNVNRPSHADFTYFQKYGHIDHRGGGRASARETAARVAAGALAMQLLKQKGIEIFAFSKQIGNRILDKNYSELNLQNIYETPTRCPDVEISEKMLQDLNAAREDGDTLGGVVSCVIRNCPAGLGEPVFDKFQAVLAHAMMSIPAAKGFEYGAGFASAKMKGSEHNDVFASANKPKTNHAGGLLGGISTGEDIYFNVAFKPIASIAKTQHTSDKNGNMIDLTIGGRHDVCAVPRAVSVVEAMAALVTADFLLRK